MNTSKDIIIERIQNYLYSFYAKDISTARNNEIYDCLCRYLMETIGKTWVDSKKIREGYEVYILSFEYLPGKFLENVIFKLGIEDDIRQALSDMDFDYETIMGFDPEPDLGIGDMGIGSTYLIRELTNNNIKATAYALRYESGNFTQVIENGMQRESSSSWLGSGSNWEHKKSFTNIINIYGRDHKVVTYDMPVLSDDAKFINTLRLFKSEPTGSVNINEFSRGDIINAYDDYINNSSITEFLYVDDSTYEGKILRLKQEYFFSASAMRDFVRRYILYYEDIRNIKDQTNVVINDIHPTLALVEFIRILTQDHGFTMKEAIFYTREIFYHLVFSITDDSLERYSIDEIRNMNADVFKTIIDIQNELSDEKDFIPFIVNGFVEFKNINIALSKEYEFLSKILKDDRDDRDNISFTNMGTDRMYFAKSANNNLTELLREYGISSFKYNDLKKLSTLINNDDFIEKAEDVKVKNKIRIIKYLGLDEKEVNPYSIFDMQLSIMHESKRQILNALAIAYQYYYIKDHTNAYVIPTTYIFSGKANEGYFIAKETIKFILALKKLIESNKDVRDKIKIIFVEDLNMTDLKYLYPACDVYSNLTHPLLDNQNFDILNSAFNMSNILSARGGIIDNLEITNEFYLMGDSYQSLKEMKNNYSYNASNFIYQNEIVKYTTENLLNESKENFPYDFKTLYDEILLYNDSFNVFYALESLVNTRKEIFNDYIDKKTWVNNELKNIIWANEFNLNNILKRNGSFEKQDR